MTTHVVPADDLIDHETTDMCPCGPLNEAVHRRDGSVGWVVVHNSLDGREHDEQTTSHP